MPREMGEPKRGPAYYSFLARHYCPGPSSAFSLPPNPFTSHVVPPHSDQNWNDDSQIPLGDLEPMPPNFDPMIDSGGCPIEEEIPPRWLEDTTVPTASIINATPLIHSVTYLYGCVIEEEIPPNWLEDSTMGTTPNVNVSFNVTIETDLGDCLTKEEIPPKWLEEATAQPTSYAHDQSNVAASGPKLLNPHKFSEDHLQLIFEMRRDMVDQLHRQSAPSHRLDLLFDSLSNDPPKRRCPTCYQPFAFIFCQDGYPSLSTL